MARIRVNKQIEVNRNPVERTLMAIKATIEQKRKIVIIGTIAVLLVSALTITLLAINESRSSKQQVRFEEIMDTYREGDVNSPENIDKTIAALKELAGSSRFGTVHQLCFYVMGNLYYQKGAYQEAVQNLVSYEKKSSSELFSALALLKAASANENLGNREKADEIYKTLEKDYIKTSAADQILYRIARFYRTGNENEKARIYYERVIAAYPTSGMAKDARSELFMMAMPPAAKPATAPGPVPVAK